MFLLALGMRVTANSAGLLPQAIEVGQDLATFLMVAARYAQRLFLSFRSSYHTSIA